MPESRPVADFFDHEYLHFAMHTVESRAIPSLVDGFKPSQRKIAFAANRIWKTGSEKPLKVNSLGSQAAAMSMYHHGSLDDTIVFMTQEWKNSLSIFDGIGQFGSLRAQTPGAPRYIHVRANRNFRRLYKDFELVDPQYEEGEEIEPKFFLPIIPPVLLNGGSGIAVGFATNILNRKPLDVVEACIEVLKTGKVRRSLVPWVRDFHGTVESKEGTDRTWLFKGCCEVKNTSTVEITEIPPSFAYEAYEAHLDSLVDKGVLHSYEDFSSDRVQYLLKLPRQTLAELLKKDKLIPLLKMWQQETENITTLDENGRLKIFEKAEDLIVYFVNFRLLYYAKRKAYLLQELDRELNVLDARARFVKAIIDGDLVVANAKKNDILSRIQELGIPKQDGSHDFLLSMPVYNLTWEKYQDLLNKIQEAKAERERVVNTSPAEFYLQDLEDLKRELRKDSNPPSEKSRKRKVSETKDAAGDVSGEDKDKDVFSLFED